MEVRHKKIDLHHVYWTTGRQQSRVESILLHAKELAEDPDNIQRRLRQECMICYYVDSRIGGAAMTKTNCAACGKKMLFGSTNVDMLCDDCSLKLRLCKHCGADFDLKRRRKLDLSVIHPVGEQHAAEEGL